MKRIFVFIWFFLFITGCSDKSTDAPTEDDSPDDIAPILPHTKWALDSKNPVLEASLGSWDKLMISHPMVIMLKDTFRMWYEGSATEVYNGIVNIGYAWSLDGVKWERKTDSPVFSALSGKWDYPHVLAPTVIVDGDTLRMWYSGGDFTSDGLRVGYAVSTDGVNWNRYPDPVIVTNKPWNKDSAIPGAVIKEGSIFKMWFTGGIRPWTAHALDTKWSIGYATSPDGIHWTQNDEPVLEHGTRSGDFDFHIVSSHTVLKTSTGYEMWYHGSRYEGALPLISKIAYATSTDGIIWKKYERNPVLSADEAEGEFGKDFFHPSVVKVGNIYHIWFAAWHPENSIGHATSTN